MKSKAGKTRAHCHMMIVHRLILYSEHAAGSAGAISSSIHCTYERHTNYRMFPAEIIRDVRKLSKHVTPGGYRLSPQSSLHDSSPKYTQYDAGTHHQRNIVRKLIKVTAAAAAAACCCAVVSRSGGNLPSVLNRLSIIMCVCLWCGGDIMVLSVLSGARDKCLSVPNCLCVTSAVSVVAAAAVAQILTRIDDVHHTLYACDSSNDDQVFDGRCCLLFADSVA